MQRQSDGRRTVKDIVLDVIRGAVMGLANVIPGVSGGTMMVSMGIYDKIIHCINHLFSEFKQSIRTLWPYLAGLVLAIVLGSVALNIAFEKFPLPTNTLFIGLILGSIPIILQQLKGEKVDAACVIFFLLCMALVIVPKAIANQTLVEGNEKGGRAALTLDLGGIVILFLLGVLASASMVIPGISGSMMLKIFGYYEPIVTDTLGGTFRTAIPQGDWGLVGHNILVLIPFGIGIVVGIFGVAKLIEMLLKRFRKWTYSGILGLVAASPVVILMDAGQWSHTINWVVIVVSVVTFAAGFIAAMRLGGGEPEAGAGKA